MNKTFTASKPSGSHLITINQGDSIHHPQHGIGTVQAIGKRSFGGGESATYAQLYFKREGLTLMVRQGDLPGTVRTPLNAREARRLLNHLERCDAKMSRQWKARANANQAAMDGGDPFAYAEVCKGLCRLEEEGALRASDRVHLNQSLVFLSEELANALGKSVEQARGLIDRRCRPQRGAA